MKTHRANNRRKVGRAASPPSRQNNVDGLDEARLETIRALAHVLDHECANLLGSLGTCTQILRRNAHLSAADTEILDIVDSGARRLGEIVAELAIFKPAAKLQLGKVDLAQLIEETLGMLQADERCSPTISVQRNLDAKIKYIEADGKVMRLVLWHLVLNAVQAIRNDGQIAIETRLVRGQIRIGIRDNGTGISRRARRHIFAPLYTTKSRALGLGLTIARRIIEDHKGKIVVESKENHGSLFTICLPAAAKKHLIGYKRSNYAREHPVG